MKHYTSEEWLDVARGVVASGKSEEMKEHVAVGCEQCKEIADEMNRLFGISRREASYEPPQESVRNAKALMAMQRAGSAVPKRHFLKVVFDSALQPLQAGVRGSATARQLLYQKENCCIDLRLEIRPGRRIEMIGQVLDSGAIGRGLNEIPVTLQKGAELLARTVTNHFGEFHFVLDDTANVEMVVDVTEDRRLVLPLPQ